VLIQERLTAQLLAGSRARDALAVVERILAVQGQDPRGFRLAVRARSTGLHVADVDRALTEERSLVVTTLNRGTLHLVRSEDYPWLQALMTPPLLTTSRTRLAQEGVSPAKTERAMKVIERELADGPRTRAQLRERLASADIATKGAALIHLVGQASLRGLIVRGPMIGKQHAFVLVKDWLGKAKAVDRDKALAELARRYLAGHGPASDRDLARWSRLPLRDVRAGLGAIEVVERDDGLLDLPGKRAPAELPAPQLLGAFDPVLLGWASREDILAPKLAKKVVDGGMFWPFALVRGRAVASWKLDRGEVELHPFSRLARADRAALERDAEAVVRYLS
jgi:hypothetical protein